MWCRNRVLKLTRNIFSSLKVGITAVLVTSYRRQSVCCTCPLDAGERYSHFSEQWLVYGTGLSYEAAQGLAFLPKPSRFSCSSCLLDTRRRYKREDLCKLVAEAGWVCGNYMCSPDPRNARLRKLTECDASGRSWLVPECCHPIRD